jgi:hypothetical protein
VDFFGGQTTQIKPPMIAEINKKPFSAPSAFGDAMWGSGINVQMGKRFSSQITAIQIRHLYLRLKLVGSF